MSWESDSGDYTVYGVDASWFTAKLRALMRVKEIRHRYQPKHGGLSQKLEARAGTRQIPVLETPEGWMVADTTPLAHLLEGWFPSRPVLPTNPVWRVASMILEDWSDEWLVRAGMYYRWQFPESVAAACASMGRDLAPPGSPEEVQQRVGAMVGAWAAKSCRAIAAEAHHGPGIEAEFEQLLGQLDEHLAVHPYLFGARPSLGELALAGGFIAHLYADPAPRAVVQRVAPHVPAWLNRIWEGDKDRAADFSQAQDDNLPPLVLAWVQQAAGAFHSFAAGNREAVVEGRKGVTVSLGDETLSLKARPYVEFSRQFIAARIGELPGEHLARVKATLGPTGALDLYGVG